MVKDFRNEKIVRVLVFTRKAKWFRRQLTKFNPLHLKFGQMDFGKYSQFGITKMKPLYLCYRLSVNNRGNGIIFKPSNCQTKADAIYGGSLSKSEHFLV